MAHHPEDRKLEPEGSTAFWYLVCVAMMFVALFRHWPVPAVIVWGVLALDQSLTFEARKIRNQLRRSAR